MLPYSTLTKHTVGDLMLSRSATEPLTRATRLFRFFFRPHTQIAFHKLCVGFVDADQQSVHFREYTRDMTLFRCLLLCWLSSGTVRSWISASSHLSTVPQHRFRYKRAPLAMTSVPMEAPTETVDYDISKALSDLNPLPKLLVFDLDATLWYPELYQIRKQYPQVNKGIHLFDAVRPVFRALQQMENPPLLAIASRTTKTQWAYQLLQEFELEEGGVSLHSIFDHMEIVPGSKKSHFANLRAVTNLAYSEMLFFDDDERMNLKEISQLGVLCCHTPRGLTVEHFVKSLTKYRELKAGHDASHWMGYILNNANLAIKESQAAAGEVLEGRVKFYSVKKRFGFVLDQASGQEFFFHESKMPAGMNIKSGDNVRFETSIDSAGRGAATILPSSAEGPMENNSLTTTMPCFTMSQPFAALLLNGIKTVESRNNKMFEDVEPGTKVLLHCGRRDWHDMESYREILGSEFGMDQDEIDNHGRLPKGFFKGNVIGMVTVGRTWETNAAERRSRDLQNRVLAPPDGIGRFCTEITSAQWLPRPFKTRGNPAVFPIDIPVDYLPENMQNSGNE